LCQKYAVATQEDSSFHNKPDKLL